MPSLIEQLSPSLFWDARRGTVDAEKHAHQVVARVAARGTLEEWRATRQYYGDDRLRSIVTTLRDLSPQAVAFCCAVLDLKREDFRCCTARPFPKAPWIY